MAAAVIGTFQCVRDCGCGDGLGDFGDLAVACFFAINTFYIIYRPRFEGQLAADIFASTGPNPLFPGLLTAFCTLKAKVAL